MAEINSSKRNHNFKDLTGQTFGKWVVLSYHSRSNAGKSRWLCQCECGEERYVTSSSLINGTSCACRKCGSKKHGKVFSPEYSAWRDMLRRCRNENSENYARYGGRGIAVCERWVTFKNFFEDMGERPSPEHSIERKNNNLGYFAENCVWATRKQQARNTRRNRMLTHDGRTMCLVAWAEEVGINSKTLRYRLNNGWSVENALAVPAKLIKQDG